MHSRIFQISTEPIDKENYLNEDTLQQGDGSFYDYCSEIDEEDRVKRILPIWSIMPCPKECSSLYPMTPCAIMVE